MVVCCSHDQLFSVQRGADVTNSLSHLIVDLFYLIPQICLGLSCIYIYINNNTNKRITTEVDARQLYN